ncbi:protein indeterminate-domain 16-like [Musa acuminata AAA Group]|uniref:protein indeterminate-domain 16-like n=1 Tax=Musa acuminata AAA Group TaxID=214697 RepID=UPI0031E44457
MLRSSPQQAVSALPVNSVSCSTASNPPRTPISSADDDKAGKRKRRPAGTPDPDAEVVSLSPRTLLESDRYVCEICHQGFQRDQNLQMHRRRHKVPWKLLRRDAAEARKRVFVCPEPSCLHHDPRHALGDLVGIKKHFRRKHSDRRQWACSRCSKAYAVQSDYKAHLKTCGTRGHSCDCGRVFSRVESFIEHQDSCSATRTFGEPATPRPSSLSWTTSSTSPSTEPTLSGRTTSTAAAAAAAAVVASSLPLALHVLPTSTSSPDSDEAQATVLQLSIGPPVGGFPSSNAGGDPREQLRQAAREKALACDARQQALKQVEMAEKELANAKTIRRQAQAELENAYLLRDHTAKQINLMLLQITCHSCRKQLQSKPGTVWEAGPKAAASYAPSAMAESKEDDINDGSHFGVSPNTQLSP